MYKSGLRHGTLKEILDALVKQGYMEKTECKRRHTSLKINGTYVSRRMLSDSPLESKPRYFYQRTEKGSKIVKQWTNLKNVYLELFGGDNK